MEPAWSYAGLREDFSLYITAICDVFKVWDPKEGWGQFWGPARVTGSVHFLFKTCLLIRLWSHLILIEESLHEKPVFCPLRLLEHAVFPPLGGKSRDGLKNTAHVSLGLSHRNAGTSQRWLLTDCQLLGLFFQPFPLQTESVCWFWWPCSLASWLNFCSKWCTPDSFLSRLAQSWKANYRRAQLFARKQRSSISTCPLPECSSNSANQSLGTSPSVQSPMIESPLTQISLLLWDHYFKLPKDCLALIFKMKIHDYSDGMLAAEHYGISH